MITKSFRNLPFKTISSGLHSFQHGCLKVVFLSPELCTVRSLLSPRTSKPQTSVDQHKPSFTWRNIADVESRVSGYDRAAHRVDSHCLALVQTAPEAPVKSPGKTLKAEFKLEVHEKMIFNGKVTRNTLRKLAFQSHLAYIHSLK